MTSGDVLGRLRRSWLVLIAGMLVTLAASYGVHHHHGIYSAQVSVYFLGPAITDDENAITYTTDSVIATAGLVAHLVAPNGDQPATATDTSLAAEGVTEGSRTRLPNAGGQWSQNFNRPVLDLQVVSKDPERARHEMEGLVAKVPSVLEQLQVKDGIQPSDRITTTQTPAAIQVHYEAGNPRRALAMTLILGAALTLLTAIHGATLRRRLQAVSRSLRFPSKTSRVLLGS